MTETLAQGLFLCALFAPPLAVIASALLLLMPEPRASRSLSHHTPLPHGR